MLFLTHSFLYCQLRPKCPKDSQYPMFHFILAALYHEFLDVESHWWKYIFICCTKWHKKRIIIWFSLSCYELLALCTNQSLYISFLVLQDYVDTNCIILCLANTLTKMKCDIYFCMNFCKTVHIVKSTQLHIPWTNIQSYILSFLPCSHYKYTLKLVEKVSRPSVCFRFKYFSVKQNFWQKALHIPWHEHYY